MPKMAKTTINLDHNATTPLDDRVSLAMAAAARDFPGNPASQHQLGRAARSRLEAVREQIGALLGANLGDRDADSILFTSGATEANNLVLRGLVGNGPTGNGPTGNGPSRVLVSAVEHPSVLQTADQLATQGHDVVKLPVDKHGVLLLDVLTEQLQTPTRLVSVMFGNHETGVRQPIAEIARLCQAAGALLHTDAVQAVGKVPIHFGELGVSALTLSAHKFHGPRGIGAIVLRRGVKPAPLLFGGPQQQGLRPGTESIALPVGLLTALELAVAGGDSDRLVAGAQMEQLRDDFERRLLAEAPEIVPIGRDVPRLPHTSCLAFEPLDRQALFLALDMAGVACSTGSACESGSSEPSPVLLEMGCSEGLVGSALRFSWGRETTAAETAEGSSRILAVYKDLRSRFEGRKTAVPATRDA